MAAINPAVMRWARETAGLTLEDAAGKLQLPAAGAASPAARLRQMEDGREAPTRAMLATMARKYRRPLITFYLEQPPRAADRGSDFRTLTQHDPREDALVDALLRDMRARQATVRSTLEVEDEAEPLDFVGAASLTDSVSVLALRIANRFRFDVDEYRRGRDPLKAFQYLRARVESSGVFVVLAGDLGSHHSELDAQVFRGFAIADPVAPFVVVNDRDSKPAWSFTLLHEVVHVWLGQTGVSGGAADRDVEKYCNDVASEMLLSESELLKQHPWLQEHNIDALQRAITSFGDARNVSSTMIAYKLYRADVISRQQWSELLGRYRALWHEHRRRERDDRANDAGGGPTYYQTRRQKLGNALIRFVTRMHDAGALSTSDAARVLGVAPRQLEPLLQGQ